MKDKEMIDNGMTDRGVMDRGMMGDGKGASGRTVIVVGGGAAGLMAGIVAARCGADVKVLEHTGRVGKKLLSTGNGKCNLTNLIMPEGAYRGEWPEFAGKVIGKVPVEETMGVFEEMGVVLSDRNGYVYPRAGQASAVLDALRFEAEHRGLEVVCGCEVKRIGKDLTVGTNLGDFKADAVILAAGSKAAPGTGSDGSGYELAKRLGHRIVKPLPALVQLRCKEGFFRALAGVRCEGLVKLLVDGTEAASDLGEVQFTDYGISGIPVFQVSRFAARALDRGKKVEAVIDLMPSMELWEVERMLTKRVAALGYRPLEEFLNGVFHKKLAGVLMKSAGINGKGITGKGTAGKGITGEGTVGGIRKEEIGRLANCMKEFRTVVTGVNPFEQAQVCSGGVDTREVDPETMESKLVKGLYLAGEILDVDGICGGYNLQFAWSSGILAGRSAAGRSAERKQNPTSDRKKSRRLR